jgi:ferredoxin
MEGNAYQQLALHLSTLGMGYPVREALIEILEENVTPAEAELMLHLPTKIGPLDAAPVDEVAEKSGLPQEEVASLLNDLADRGMLYCGETEGGEKGYALLQVGYGFPQTFFWKGEDTPHAQRMAELMGKYFGREVTREAYSASKTKAFRYIPVDESIVPQTQAVFPHHAMESVLQGAETFAVAQCPCRVAYGLRGRECDHPLEVCLKFDEMAEHAIERGFGRRITREEARDIVQQSAEAGLVHFVDNAQEGVKHNCNCCGCSCWNVGTIRRRKVPRDDLMQTYFMRVTDEGACVGCGVCEEICPVAAVAQEDGPPAVDEEWCIGCGVCAAKCPNGAAGVEPRTDLEQEPPREFRELHDRILEEKGLR